MFGTMVASSIIEQRSYGDVDADVDDSRNWNEIINDPRLGLNDFRSLLKTT